MTLAANKAAARRWFEEVINGRRLDAIDEVFGPAYVNHSNGHDTPLAEIRDAAEHLLASSADRHATILDQVAEGNRVATRWESVGTFDGGRRATMRGMVIARIEDDRIAESWETLDTLSFLRDLGEIEEEDE